LAAVRAYDLLDLRLRRGRGGDDEDATGHRGRSLPSRGSETAAAYPGAVRAYLPRARAAEYDDWWLGRGLFAERDRPGWDDEAARLVAALAALPPARTLDVACGTGFLTRHLPGEVVALDQSEAMAAIARRQAPEATVVVGDALALPFADGAFERVFASFF